jgi:superfamily II DNA or RNA helicase
LNHAITSLRDLPLALSYQSGTHDLVRDFYLPCLGAAKLYQRAVGYFSSQGLALAAQGLQQLLEKGGRMQLIASPVLHEEDIQAIRAGYDQRSILETAARRELDPANLPPDDLLRDRLKTLAWLIAAGRLDVRLAVGAKGGLFHLKIGLFTDNDGNCVAFSGSANETHGGLVSNYEAIEVFTSWKDPERVADKRMQFASLWGNIALGLNCLDFTAFAAELLQPYAGAAYPQAASNFLEVAETQAKAGALWPHQVAAIAAWEANQRVGILEMCTGAGKTVTALNVVTKSKDDPRLDFAVIVCPTKILVEQWAQQAEKLKGCNVLKAYDSYANYRNELKFFFAKRDKRFNVIITTYATFFDDNLSYWSKQAAAAGCRALLILDEAHNCSSANFTKLQDWATLYPQRLGLSATPYRGYSQELDDEQRAFFGKVVFHFGLKEGIERGILTRYHYFPIPIHIEAKLSRGSWFAAEDDAPRDFLKGNADRYLGAFTALIDRLLPQQGRLDKLIVFCPPGGIEETRALERFREVLRAHSISSASITAATSGADRQGILRDFAAQTYQALFAIGCLDEGMDIPSSQKCVITYSFDTPRQFVQRRGRVLRQSQGKTHAQIYDFILLPDSSTFSPEKTEQILEREMRRYYDFSQLADNQTEAESILQAAIRKVKSTSLNQVLGDDYES